MRIFVALLKKEYLESVRNKKFFVMLFIFAFLGVLGPVTAKISPEILKSVLNAELLSGLPSPTFMDSWVQFFKNINQLGFIFLVIILSNYIVSEFSKGTLVNLVAKGLPRFQIVISKIIFAYILWTFFYLIYFIIFNIYTNVIFKENVEILLALKSSVSIWIFGIFIITVECFAGFLFKNIIGVLSMVVFIVAIQFLLGISKEIFKFLPMFLISDNISIIKGNLTLSAYNFSIIVSILSIVVMIFGSILILNKREI